MATLQSELAKLVSDVNGRHGEVDWTPIRYLNKGYQPDRAGGTLSHRAGRRGDAAQ